VKQEVKAREFHVFFFSHPGVLKKVNINRNILQRYFTCKKNLGVPTIVVNVFWRKTFISKCDPTPPTLNSFTSMKCYIFANVLNERSKRINNADLFLQPSLIIFTRGANNSDLNCIC